MEQYIRRLIYLDMNKRNYTKILKAIRKLHWEEQEVCLLEVCEVSIIHTNTP